MKQTWKQAASVGGILLMIGGGLALPGGLAWLFLLMDEPASGRSFGMAWLSFEALAFAGYLLVHHARRSLLGKPSTPLRLPSLWLLGGIFALALLIGLAAQGPRPTSLQALVFPLQFLLAGVLPPLLALAWILRDLPGTLSWRQFVVAFVSGTTIAVVLAIVLETILPTVILFLVAGLFEFVRGIWGAFVEALAGGEVAEALSSSGFFLAWIQLAVVAPLVEELVKPLALLPLIKSRPRRTPAGPRWAFLIGAAAGAGFAALENLLYTGLALDYWGGVVVLRALGAAVHPLGSGLVALGWYELFYPQPSAKRSLGQAHPWLSRYGLAVGLHALWNGGSLLMIALVGAEFFGAATPEVDVLGVTLAGTLLALLALVGAGAAVGMRAIARRLAAPAGEEPGRLAEDAAVPPEPGDTEVVSWQADRTMALWALICLAAALPLGLAVLNVLRGGS